MNLHYEQLGKQHTETKAGTNNRFNYLVNIRNYILSFNTFVHDLTSKTIYKLNNNKTQTFELLCFEMILTA